MTHTQVKVALEPEDCTSTTWLNLQPSWKPK